MHILLLTTSFPVREGASSGVFVERLAQRLGRNCHLSVLAPAGDFPSNNSKSKPYNLFTFRYAPKKLQILAHGGGGIPAALSAHPLTILLLPFFLFSMLANCMWHARKADVIFANWSICGVIAGIVGILIGRPVITTIRGEDANRAQYSRIHRFLIGLCLRLNKRLVTVSDDISTRLSELFPAMAYKLVMIPNGVDFMPRLESFKKPGDSEMVRIIMIGSLIPRKSVSTALHALTLLPSDFSLTIIGDGPERNKLSSLTNVLGLKGRVRFEGHVQPEEIQSWFARADVLLMTSKSEGRPNAVLEALAAGVPVVGSDIPGIRELIIPDVNGVLFPCGDYRALSTSLTPLADRVLRLRLGEGGRRLIVERGLTWENTADRYMNEFRQACSKGNA